MTIKTMNLKLQLPPHKTKIVCVIGPASRSPEVLEELIRSGMNAVQVNH